MEGINDLFKVVKVLIRIGSGSKSSELEIKEANQLGFHTILLPKK